MSGRTAVRILVIFLSAISALPSFAMNGRTTYQAKIARPDGYPLESASVNFRFTVLDTVGSCILYVEDYAAINMRDTGGLVSFSLGNGTRSFPTSGSATTFKDIFDNSVASFPCQNAGVYNPGPSDVRKIVMQFNEGIGWQTLPAMTINSVPYAMYATEAINAKTLNGKSDSAFVENSTLAALNCQPNEALRFNGASFSCVNVSVSASTVVAALGYTPLASVSATAPLFSTGGSTPMLSITQASSSTQGYLSSTDWTTFNNKQNATQAAIIATLGYTPADSAVSGTYVQRTNNLSDLTNITAARTNLGLGSFATANSIDLGSASATGIIADARLANQTAITSGTQYTKVTVDAKGRVTNGASLSSADVTTALGFTPADNAVSGTYVQRTNNLSDLTNISTARTNLGLGSFATANSIDLSSASATGIIADARLMNQTAITSGTQYTKVTVDGKGRVTNGASLSSADVTTALGFTPADNAASGTYVQRANNLSDLTNITTARTNLGLGSFATANSIDLGSASATGIIADARLMNQTAITSGTQYTKVTVDGKGRVTNGASLSSADVTTALGFTPANNAASGTYAQKANNLSDLANIATARTNLGLGSFATANSIDLGSASATGIIADARLANQTAITSGTQYTKVTVDGKGRVTNGASLSSSDVTTALGFSPAQASSATQWTTAGSSIYYNLGNVGIGTNSPTSKLHVDGDIRNHTTSQAVFTNNLAILSSAADMNINYSSAKLNIFSDTNSTMTLLRNGNVGVGTATPSAKLDVAGQVKTSMGTPLVNPAGNAVDFATGNTQYVTFSACPGNALTVNLYSVFEGSSYSIVVIAPSGCLVDFTGISHAYGGSGGTAVTAFKYPAGQKFSSTGNPMVYSFLRANNFVFVAQVVDFQ